MSQKTIIIGISGASGSGKSLLANTIVEELGSNRVIVIPQDSYYRHRPDLSFSEREKINYDHPDSMDLDLLYAHLQALHQGHSIELPQYDHSEHARRKKTVTISNHSIIVLEGILLFVEERLRKFMDIRLFMDTPLDICLMRRLRRDIMMRKRSVESVLEQYESTVRPMYLQFIEPTKRYADIIVPRGGENRIAVDLLKAQMRELLNK